MQPTAYHTDEIEQLLQLLNQQHPGWQLLEGKLTKTYKFRNFNQAFAFMTSIALYAEKIDHHPEWSNVYNRVKVGLITHSVAGITHLDTDLARHMDSQAHLYTA